MIRKNTVLAGTVLVVLAGAMFGAVTMSYFTDTAVSMGNTFTATTETPDLKIKDPSTLEWVDEVGAQWTVSNMIPGDGPWPGSFDLKNEGTPADEMVITCSYDVTCPLETVTADAMAKQMVITYIHYYDYVYDINCLTGEDEDGALGQSEDWKVEDTDADGRTTLYDLNQDPLHLPPCDGSTTLDMKLKFYEGAGNEFQGVTIDVTIIFTLVM